MGTGRKSTRLNELASMVLVYRTTDCAANVLGKDRCKDFFISLCQVILFCIARAV